MPTPVKYLVILLNSVGVGMLSWAVGGLLKWNEPLIQEGFTTYMDVRGAIGIGVGALAGALTSATLFHPRASASIAIQKSHETFDYP